MSLEITLYTKTATKKSLIAMLKDNGFNKSKHFIPEFNTPDRLGFMWFGFDDFESSTGTEATIYYASSETREKFKCGEWILNTRTRASGSYEDKKKQNDIIKLARARFGGTFYNDWYGTNRYTLLKDYPQRTPLEKAIKIIRDNALESIEKIRSCLETYKHPFDEHTRGIENSPLAQFVKFNDPSVALFNALVPFLVSVLEYYFSQTFEAFARYDDDSRTQLSQEKHKFNVTDILRIQNKQTTLERLIADCYNFQNLGSIHKAFNTYIGIDIISILSKKRKVNGKVYRIYQMLENIIGFRHQVIHDMAFDYDLTKEEYLRYTDTVAKTIYLITEHLSTHRKLTIEDSYIL